MATDTSDVRIELPGRMMILLQGTFSSINSLIFYLKGTSLTIERLTIPCRVVE